MKTNDRLIQIMKEQGMDTRSDPTRNVEDTQQIADLLGCTRWAVIAWLAPEHWKSKHRKMPAGLLELLEIKLGYRKP